MAKSIMEQIADLPDDERALVMAGMDPDMLLWDWSVWGRPEQFAPPGDEWNVWLVLAGRGFGKTRLAAEWVREQAKYTSSGQRRFALVARTAADVRDVIVEGESGVMNVSPPSEKPLYEPSKRRLTWPNGNVATLFTADEPDSLRGPQFRLDVRTPIPTPSGWKRMGDLADGDTIFDERGRPTTVTKAHEIAVAWDAYRVRFSDGTHLDADGKHLWLTITSRDVTDILDVPHGWGLRPLGPGASNHVPKTTLEIMATLGEGVRHYIPSTEPLQYSTTAETWGALPVKPWVLGSALGVHRPSGGDGSVLRTLRVSGAASGAIPTKYLEAGYDERLELLSALLESGAHQDESGAYVFKSRSKPLVLSAVELCRSLGLVPHHYENFVPAKGGGRPRSWWNLKVRLGSERAVREIVSIERIPPTLMRCITVDSESHLYLAGNGMVPTHNTHAWGDEIAAWRQTPDAAGMTAFDNLRVGTRLGARPQMVVTTTPKRVPLLYRLLEEADKTKNVVVTRGSTLDNAGNLSGAYLETMLGVYEGTSLAKQELYGEMLDNVEGALWFDNMIEPYRENSYPMSTPLRVIGVDPSVAENPRDECGIVVVASTAERDLYRRESWVLEDASILGAPNVWAQRVVEMARKWGCPVVAEVNQGGALVRNAIQAIDPSIVVLEVHSKYGKALRAEPVTLAYEQGRVHHVGYLTDLESQMYSWIPGEGKSPDRVDALVHALTALLIKPPPGFTGGKITARSHAGRKLPGLRSRGGSGPSFRVR